MRDIPVTRIMTTEPVTVAPAQPIIDARKIFDSQDLNHLPVVQDKKLVGMLSASDMLKFFMLDHDAEALGSIVVRQAMQSQPISLPADANLRDAAKRLSSGSFHALPVIDADHVLVGIVTSSDLVRHLLRQIPVGDGSIESTGARPAAMTSSSEISSTITALQQKAAQGSQLQDLEKVLLALDARTKRLAAVCEAAERYIRSGHADHEHSILVKRLDDLRSATQVLDL